MVTNNNLEETTNVVPTPSSLSTMIIPGSKVLVRALKINTDRGFQLQQDIKETPKYQNRGVVLKVGNNMNELYSSIEEGDIIDFRLEAFANLVILDKSAGKPIEIETVDPLFLVDDYLIEWYTKA